MDIADNVVDVASVNDNLAEARFYKTAFELSQFGTGFEGHNFISRNQAVARFEVRKVKGVL